MWKSTMQKLKWEKCFLDYSFDGKKADDFSSDILKNLESDGLDIILDVQRSMIR